MTTDTPSTPTDDEAPPPEPEGDDPGAPGPHDETVLDGTVLDGTVLDGTVLDGTVLDETVLDETVLDETVLDETVLDETVRDEGAHDDWVEETPAYLKPRFVAGMVALALVVGLLLTTWGNSGNRRLDPGIVGRASVPVAAEASRPDVGTVEDCPAPGAPVDLNAAKAVRLFLAAAAGQNLAGMQATDEVKAQLTANAPNPAVLRMTRSHGFSTDSGTVSSCVQSYWSEGDGIRTSADLVVVVPAAKGWQVKQWIRGEPVELGRTESVPLSFYNGSGSCGTPDRIASVQLAAGPPGDRLREAVEELASGSAGRAIGAASPIPADVQVVSATVDGLSARVELTATSEKLNDCPGKAAVNQITSTATAIALAALPPDQTTTTAPAKGTKSRQAAPPAVAVEVVVDGATVTTLRR